MFNNDLYGEFKTLYQASLKKKVSLDLLKQTLGYRQFLEMAQVSNQSPLKLEGAELSKVKQWIIKDILKYAYSQTLAYKKFPGTRLVKNFNQARVYIDSFLER